MDFPIWQAGFSIAGGIGLAGPMAYFSPWFWQLHRMGAIRREIAHSRILALTYDDGPSPAVTPQLLDLLRQRDARATFFMLGRHAQRYPQIADRIIAEGHDVGCHSYNHLNAWRTTPCSSITDIQAGYDRLSPWVPRDGKFRPAYGKMTLPTYWAIRRRGAPVWWWTIDSGDTRNRIPKPSQVAAALRRDKGGIVLIHDLDRDSERNQFVLEVTETLLDEAVRESFKVTTLGELCT